VAEPLDYERPRPRPRKQFMPPGWKPVEVMFFLFVFMAAALADDYVGALGCPGWLRMTGMAAVLYVGLWLSGRWRTRDL
jgi:hypothetical protein